MRKKELCIYEAEEQLFQKWQENREGFVRDGVVSEEDYIVSKPKIAFILKEVNDPGGGGWDLRNFVSEGGRPQTWNNIARWVYGIRNITSIPKWDFFENISEEFRIKTLQSICAINLKKSPGTHTTDQASLKAVANEDRVFIQKQYKLYDPDITVCGGTGDLFKWVAGHESLEWKMTTRGIWWYEQEANKIVISFTHPEARVQSSLIVYALLDAIQEIYAEQGKCDWTTKSAAPS